MPRKNLAYFDGQYGWVTLAEDGYEITTTTAHCDRYIHVDDGQCYPQLCADGSFSGNTLIWASNRDDIPKHFARDCNAKLYKTRAGYAKARAAMRANIGLYGYPDADQPIYA
jgi:hypothetical protein